MGHARDAGVFSRYLWKYGTNSANDEASKFKRGSIWSRVKPIGFDNEVLEDQYTSQYSEMNWQGPDGTEIFGLLFANWYSNGNEIPAEETAAKAFGIKNWQMSKSMRRLNIY